MAKKYALVRVEDNCPFMQEKLDFSSCRKMFNCDKFIRCEECEHNCHYGDTKEQLIRKVAQVIKRITNDGYVVAYKKFGTGYINTALNIKDVAKEIVEFLGVEE